MRGHLRVTVPARRAGATGRASACSAGAPGYVRHVSITMEQRHAIARLIAEPYDEHNEREAPLPVPLLDVVHAYITSMCEIIERRAPHVWPEAKPVADEAREPVPSRSWGTLAGEWWRALMDEDAWDETTTPPTGVPATHAIEAVYKLLHFPRKLAFGWRSLQSPLAAMQMALEADEREGDTAAVLLEPLGFSGIELDVAVRAADQVSSMEEWRSVVARLARGR